jgi:hypothetical protein
LFKVNSQVRVFLPTLLIPLESELGNSRKVEKTTSRLLQHFEKRGVQAEVVTIASEVVVPSHRSVLLHFIVAIETGLTAGQCWIP